MQVAARPFICNEQPIATIVGRLDGAIGAALTQIGAPSAL
jgi:hypothetical protein